MLAGIVLSHGIQCTGGMAATMPAGMDGTATASMHRHVVANHADAGTHMGLGAVVSRTAEEPGGLLAACVIVLVAVTVALVAVRPGWRRLLSSVVGSERIPVPRRAVAVPRVSLAELCLLRT